MPCIELCESEDEAYVSLEPTESSGANGSLGPIKTHKALKLEYNWSPTSKLQYTKWEKTSLGEKVHGDTTSNHNQREGSD